MDEAIITSITVFISSRQKYDEKHDEDTCHANNDRLAFKLMPDVAIALVALEGVDIAILVNIQLIVRC